MEKLVLRHNILCLYLQRSHNILFASYENPIIRTGS